jgi:hypothetical protein
METGGEAPLHGRLVRLALRAGAAILDGFARLGDDFYMSAPSGYIAYSEAGNGIDPAVDDAMAAFEESFRRT